MKCMILDAEIDEEECELIIKESYLSKKSKNLPKKVKRVVGWDWICKTCEYHKKPE